MPRLVVEDDRVLRLVRVLLDPTSPADRRAAFAEYFRHDLPDFEGWAAATVAATPGLRPSEVVEVADQAALEAALPGADGVIVEDLRIDAAAVARAPKLRVVQSFGSLLRGVDAAACAQRGIPVLTQRRRVNIAVAEHGMAMLMALAKRLDRIDGLVTYQRLRDQGFAAGAFDTRHTANANWGRVPGLKKVQGSTLALIGLGEIGREVARLAVGVGMRVQYFQRHRLSEAEETALGVAYATFDDCLATADFVSVHVPKEVTDLIDTAAFAHMRRGTILINTARAQSVNRAALLAALDSGHLGGAGLDVHYQEPMADDDPLLDKPNVILTPHLAGGSRFNGLADMAEMLARVADALR